MSTLPLLKSWLSRATTFGRKKTEPEQVHWLRLSPEYAIEIPSHYPDELRDELLSMVGVEGKEILLFDAINLMTKSKASVSTIREHLAYRHYISADSWIAGNLLASMHCYPQLPLMDDYSKASPSLHNQIAGLIIATKALYIEDRVRSNRGEYETLPVSDGEITNRKGNLAIALTDNYIVDLILDHPERAEEIARIIIKRDTTDTGFIRSILITDSQAMSEGTL